MTILLMSVLFVVIILYNNQLGSNILMDLDVDVSFDQLIHPDQILKLLQFHTDYDDYEHPWQIVEYIRICNKYYGTKLFVFVNLNHIFDKEEVDIVISAVKSLNINVILLESEQHPIVNRFEQQIIIDEDMCII